MTRPTFQPSAASPARLFGGGPELRLGRSGGRRTSVCGISPETFPTCEFHRGNFGGRFGTMLKLAGWDGVVVEGRADKPVWINIINDKVTIEDAKELWGLDTWETQDRIQPWWAAEPGSAKNGSRSASLYHGPPADCLHRPGRRGQVAARGPDSPAAACSARMRRLWRGFWGEESEGHQRHRYRQCEDGGSQGRPGCQIGRYADADK